MPEYDHVIGIDPGLSGAIAVLPEQVIHDMPTAGTAKRDEYLPAEMANLLRPYAKGTLVVLERQQTHPRQSSSSSFKIGVGYGLWLGIVATLGIPVQVVSPQDWKKVMLRGRSHEKGMSLVVAQEMFPGLLHMLKRVKDHDRAEALLIAQFGLQGVAL